MKKRLLLITALLCAVAQWVQAQTYITDVLLVGDDSETEATQRYESLEQQGWTGINVDLNRNAGGHCIYLMYKTSNSKYSSRVPITDFFLRVSKSANTPDSFSFDGRTYQLTNYNLNLDGKFTASKGSLTTNAGSDYMIHLYYTKDEFTPSSAVTSISIDENSANAMGENGGATPCDLNKDAGGDYLYMHFTKALTTPIEVPDSGVYYIEHGWDSVNKKLTSTVQTLASGDFTVLSGNKTGDLHLSGGNYVVQGNVHVSDFIFVEGNTNLILCDGAKLTVAKGVLVSPPEGQNCTLSIFGQVANSGWLVNEQEQQSPAFDSQTTWENPAYPGLGTFSGMRSTINIHGGSIDVKARNGYSAAIGNGQTRDLGTINFYGGNITATGGFYNEKTGSTANPSVFPYHSPAIGSIAKRPNGNINIYGGNIRAIGKYGPGIGVGNQIEMYAVNGFKITINGGNVYAEGGSSGAAGIGGAQETDGKTVVINGGRVEAYGGSNAAGIGSGKAPSLNPLHGGTLTVNGGEVYAYGGDSGPTNPFNEGGAGIGGGYGCNGANVTVNGGKVYAYGNDDGAGIGSGTNMENVRYEYNINGGTLVVNGGEVYAYGDGDGAGIGGGYKNSGAKVTISGGIVVAEAGKHATGRRAIGPGYENDDYGQLTIGDLMMVGSERLATAVERKNMCWYRTRVRVEPCKHGSQTYTINNSNTHTVHCALCTTTFDAEAHTWENEVCTLCGAGKTTYTVSIYLPDGNNYSSAATYTMATDAVFNLPAPPDANTPVGMEFAGWCQGVPAEQESFVTNGIEDLLPVGHTYTISGNVSFTARYRNIVISLADNTSNGEVLSTYDNKLAHTVTLTGRTLWKDNSWNTLCLPFSLSEAEVTAQLTPDALKTLSSSGYDSKTATLTLDFTDATTIEAGKPYIIKWAKPNPYTAYDGNNAATCSDIVNPSFTNVNINNVQNPVITDYVTFTGNSSPVTLAGGERSTLYLGAGNTLYYPSSNKTIGAFRAYFQLNGIKADDPASPSTPEVRAFVLNFGDSDATGVSTPHALWRGAGGESWYTLDGRKLSGKPMQRGIYINNAKKVVINRTSK